MESVVRHRHSRPEPEPAIFPRTGFVSQSVNKGPHHAGINWNFYTKANMKPETRVSRRDFIRAANAAAMLAPVIVPSHVWGAETPPSESPANSARPIAP